MSHVEDGQWIMRGLAWNDPGRIRTWQELVTWIDKIGFVPLFRNEVEGFSVEEHTSTRYWWTGSRREDPWEWRENKRGEEYGMAVSIPLPPEAIWGYEAVTAAYSEDPAVSRERIVTHVRKLYPDAAEKDIDRLVGK
ncbi:MAG: hypothetical protein J6Y10_05480 [Lachnospiraceae bacterium]|nr:hypothetical protein [Lachnospiraceae bacterium]